MILTDYEQRYTLHRARCVLQDMAVPVVASTFVSYADPDAYELRFLTSTDALVTTRYHAIRLTEEHLWRLRQAVQESYQQLLFARHPDGPDPVDVFLRPLLTALPRPQPSARRGEETT